ncbi:hypothetical protein N9W78_00180 [bacterium]|nr:hypothetical protein [bacterium]
MITPIIVVLILTSPLGLAWLFSRQTGRHLNTGFWATIGLATTFIFFFVGHLVQTAGMVAMLPPWVPQRLALVYATAVLEILIAIGLLFEDSRRPALLAAMAVLVLFYPANIYAAWQQIDYAGYRWGLSYLWIRTPLQLLLLGWAYWMCWRPAQQQPSAMAV